MNDVVLAKGGILYGLFLAPKTKYCIVIDEKGMICKKTNFKGFDRNMGGLNFKDFPVLQRSGTILGNSKLNRKRDLFAVRIPHRVFQCPQCVHDKTCN